MANNRMFLKCKKCNETHILMKYYPSQCWYLFVPYTIKKFNYENMETDLNEWVEKHFVECYDKDYDTGGNPFELEYEEKAGKKDG